LFKKTPLKAQNGYIPKIFGGAIAPLALPGYAYVYNQHSYRADAEVKFYKYRFPILFSRGVLKATLITLCFIPTNDLEINKPNFVVGHGVVVQLGWTTIRL